MALDQPTAAADESTAGESERVKSFTAFGYRDFNFYVLIRSSNTLTQNMLAVALGWQIYDITNRPIDLGLVGLAQFVPTLLLTLPAGVIADRFDRLFILRASLALNAVATLLLLWQMTSGHFRILPVLAVLALSATAKAFANPAQRATLPNIVKPAHLQNAVAWDSSFWQGAVLGGPAAAGFLYELGPWAVYGTIAAFSIAGLVGAMLIQTRSQSRPVGGSALARLTSGLRYVWSQPVLFGAISLDLFAVLLGGATALLPVYARDILSVGPIGLGMLRGAPALGAAICAVLQARFPVQRHTGMIMLLCVAGFGIATILFGIATNFIWALFLLILLGAFDMISVNIRQILLQLKTPDAMRGRVGSVNLLFTSTTSSLGAFESGITAQWWGTVPSVVIGGIGTLFVVALWAWKFRELRQVDNLVDPV